MREIQLRWSHSGFLVLPGDRIALTEAEPFIISGERLIDPELFRGRSVAYGWPALTFLGWRASIILELCEIGFPEELSIERKTLARMNISSLLNGYITLEDCIAQLALV